MTAISNRNMCDDVCGELEILFSRLLSFRYLVMATVAIIPFLLLYLLWRRLKLTSLLNRSKSRQNWMPHDPNVNNLLKSPEALPAKLSAKLEFLERNKTSYGYPHSKKGFIDKWRPIEFPSLLPPLQILTPARNQHYTQFDQGPFQTSIEPEVYLDYAGSALPTRSQLSRVFEQCMVLPKTSSSENPSSVHQTFDNFADEICQTQILANPHSLGGGIASDRTWKLMQQSIHRVMKHFGVDDEQKNFEDLGTGGEKALFPGYRLVFTSGATESLRIVAERFPWSFRTVCRHTSLKATFTCSNTHKVSRMDTKGNGIRRSSCTASRVMSVRVRSTLVYPRNVHTSVIGMRNVALSHGAQFQCVSVEDLQNASSAWFHNIVDQSMEYEEDDILNPSLKIEDEQHIETTDTAGNFHTIPMRTVWVHNLLVLPVECNFGGDRFEWSNTVSAARNSMCVTYLNCVSSSAESDSQWANKSLIRICHKWHVLLDIAKAAATSEVNISTVVPNGPDFAIVSFYKIFGHPTGLGALFVKNQGHAKSTSIDLEKEVKVPQVGEDAIKVTNHDKNLDSMIETQPKRRHYFGGGSVDVVMPHKDLTIPRNTRKTSSNDDFASTASKDCGEEFINLGSLVNGTQHFRGIVELIHGFQEIDELGGMSKISLHSTCLASELVKRFSYLRRDNRKPVVLVYGQWKSFADGLESPGRNNKTTSIGSTVAFNISDREGSIIGYDEFSRLASLNQPPIQIRTGCFCNPGACQDALVLSDDDIMENYSSGHVCGDRNGIINGRPTGCIRASFGKDSLWEDMDALVSFIEKVFVSRGEIPRSQEIVSVPGNISRFEIDSMYIFPIKSCAAMQVRSWPIENNTGKMLFDREFALVDASGAAMRLSSYPKMSQICPTIDLSTNTMTVRAPQLSDLILNLEKSDMINVTSEDVEVCGVLCKGNVWGGKEASNWFTSALGVRCWLARHDEPMGVNTSSKGNHTKQTSYSNEAALLLVSQKSISVLNSIIREQGWGRQVEPRHFRPNIVVSANGSDNQPENDDHNPEDLWKKICVKGKTGHVILVAAGKCARCQMVDIDPSGVKGNTLRALAQYRRDRGRIYFGSFFSGRKDVTDAESTVTWIEVGDEVVSVD
ncbi:hypothetical protein ACHAW6_011117 [Cyclotella cf. meneghiniana]